MPPRKFPQSGRFAGSARPMHRGIARNLPAPQPSRLPGPAIRAEDARMMRRALASLAVCWLAYCSGAPYPTLPPNPYPLAFGMTPPEAAAALGVPLHRLARRSQVYIAVGQAPIPGFYITDTGMALQF